jgi:hypothetical protein
MTTDTNQLERLPCELLEKILGLLTVPDILRLKQVRNDIQTRCPRDPAELLTIGNAWFSRSRS